MPKKNLVDKLNLKYFLHPVRLIVLILVLLYIFGVAPRLHFDVQGILMHPLVKLALVFVLFSFAHLDGPLSFLLFVALLVTFVPELVRGVGSGTSKLVKGTAEGASSVVGGVTETGKQLVGGVAGGTQQLVGGVSGGTQQLVSSVAQGTQQLLGSVGEGVQEILQGAGEAVDEVVSAATKENLVNSNINNGSGSSCQAVPMHMKGCDPNVGHNASFIRQKNSESCLFDGVKVWKDEIGPQGLNRGNSVMGWSGGQVGAFY